MAAAKTAAQSSGGFDFGALLSNPQVLGALVAAVAGLWAKFTGPKAPPVVVLPGQPPVPNPNGSDPNFPDDVIPPPASTGSRKVSKIKYALTRVQLNAQRFPKQAGYLYTEEELQGVRNGKAIPYASKVWFDITLYDQNGLEFLRDAVIANGLEYKNEHHAGDSFIIGDGVTTPGGDPKPYQTGGEEFGRGISAWLSSRGFLHQMKASNQGSFDCYAKGGGLESAHFKLNVS